MTGNAALSLSRSYPSFLRRFLRRFHRFLPRSGNPLPAGGCLQSDLFHLLFDDDRLDNHRLECLIEIPQKLPFQQFHSSLPPGPLEVKLCLGTHGHAIEIFFQHDIKENQKKAIKINDITREIIQLKDIKSKLNIENINKNEEILIEPVNHFQLMIEAFGNEIIKSNHNKFNFEEDLLNQAKVMEACRISNDEKRYVEIKEIK